MGGPLLILGMQSGWYPRAELNVAGRNTKENQKILKSLLTLAENGCYSSKQQSKYITTRSRSTITTIYYILYRTSTRSNGLTRGTLKVIKGIFDHQGNKLTGMHSAGPTRQSQSSFDVLYPPDTTSQVTYVQSSL